MMFNVSEYSFLKFDGYAQFMAVDDSNSRVFLIQGQDEHVGGEAGCCLET
jgi:hypothetical protein